MRGTGTRRACIIRTSCLVGAMLASGCMVRVGGNQPTEETNTGVTEAEYGVYSYMLRTIGTAQFKILGDSTLIRTIPPRSICKIPEQSDCVPSSPPIVAAWQNFLRANERRWPLEPLFARDLRVTLERDAQPSDSTCHSPTIIRFSRVGFDSARNHAVVTMFIRTGKGPFPGCGGVSLMTVVLERQRDTWKRIAYIESLET